MTDEEWKKFQQWHSSGASPQSTGAPDEGGGMLGSVWAGVKGAGKELTGDVQSLGGGPGEWAKSKDPQHPTAEWVGRTAADWAPVVGFDALAPEVGLGATAARFAPRVARLAEKGLTGAYKGAVGGAAMQPSERGAATGSEVGAASGVARAGWSMLPGWAKAGAIGVPGSLAGIASLAHEMGGGGRYISPWAVHHVLSALGGLASAAAAGPATAGAGGSAIENWLDPENGGQ
ncbi:MAG TPA: hypothetical protein VHT52_10515 [Stellaceae bacterium]|jgi:hypothetical protein|nr:hypothetical protein [Stellaceae bacterium]